MNYDIKWRHYSEFTHGAVLKELHLKSPKKILDLGCGTGLLLSKISKKYPKAKLYGVDSDAQMLKIANKRLPNAKFKKGNIEKKLFKYNEFDLIVSSSVLHFTDAPKVIGQMYEYLKKDGKVIILDFRNDGYFKIVNFIFNLLYGKQRALSSGEFLEIMKRTGFKKIRQKKLKWRHYLFQVAKAEKV